MKKGINILGALLLGLLAIGGGVASASFSDVSSGHQNFDAISYVQEFGIVGGYPDGSYRPDSAINRAEFTKILVETDFTEQTIGNCLADNTHDSWTYVFFPDVAPNQWFTSYICVAKLNGVVTGFPDGSFKPGELINFVEAAKIIVSTFGYSYDSSDVWYQGYVEALAERGAIPTSISAFDHKVTRGEMAEMIYRLEMDITNRPSMVYSAEGLRL